MSTWTHRRGLPLFATILAVAPLALAQRSGGNTPPGATNTNPATSTGTLGTTNPSNPNGRLGTSNPNQGANQGNPINDRPVFISGRVQFDDGTSEYRDVRIERVFGINVRPEAHADNKGRFSFQVGGNAAMDLTAGDASTSGFGDPTRRSTNSGTSNLGGTGGYSANALWGCDLRASYPGYRSDVLPLGMHRSLDDPNVGTIILHRLAEVKGSTISVTTAEAPKAAQKNYEKGMQLAQKGKFDEAEKHLVEATTLYPKYAVAWFALGDMQANQNKEEDARKSYLAAIAADKRYVSPYDHLAMMAARANRWEEALDYSKQAIALNPVEFPSAFWYNAVANYNLNKPDAALESAQRLVKMDSRHSFPEANRMLAAFALDHKEYAAAATYLQTYLNEAPKAKDAETLKQQLQKIQEASAGGAPKQ